MLIFQGVIHGSICLVSPTTFGQQDPVDLESIPGPEAGQALLNNISVLVAGVVWFLA